MRLALTGIAAGLVFGYVLQRSDQCFHATWSGLYDRSYGRARAWILGVGVASVGLAVLYAGDWWALSEGLALRPVHNVVGGLTVGVGMVIASSCTSGLFYKLGSGMLAAAVGIGAWALGELAAADVDLPGSVALDHGEGATVSGWLGVPRWTAVVVFGAGVWLLLRRAGDRQGVKGHWGWPIAGAALGLATVATWVLAGVGGSRFGASTVGGVRSVADGDPNWWLLGFLAALVPGATYAARRSGTLWVRGERMTRYVGLAAGGFLLGAGGRIGGGCNLGHGMSGVAQLNISSWLVVASIVAGIGLARAARRALLRARDRAPEAAYWTPAIDSRG